VTDDQLVSKLKKAVGYVTIYHHLSWSSLPSPGLFFPPLSLVSLGISLVNTRYLKVSTVHDLPLLSTTHH
jgi:hypothetical protein